MTSPYLLGDLKMEEGFRADAYPDPLSHGPPWTIGYGHTGPEVHEGLVWTEAQASDALAADVAAKLRQLDADLPWWRDLDDLRQDVLADMAFNMGVAGLLAFHTFLGFVKDGDYAEAALDLRGTTWYHQVPRRAERLRQQMTTGEHVPPI